MKLLLEQLRESRDVGDIVNAVTKVVKPYAEIRHWTFSRDPESRVLRFFLRLDDESLHEQIASLLGGVVVGPSICIEIKLQAVLVPPQLDQGDDGPARARNADSGARASGGRGTGRA